MSEKLLEVKNLKTYFYTDEGVVKSVDDVSFDVEKGKTLGIVENRLRKKYYISFYHAAGRDSTGKNCGWRNHLSGAKTFWKRIKIKCVRFVAAKSL